MKNQNQRVTNVKISNSKNEMLIKKCIRNLPPKASKIKKLNLKNEMLIKKCIRKKKEFV